MDRKDFFKTLAPKKTPAKSQRFFSGIAPYTGPWTSTEATHLLRRTMFGARKTDVDYFAAMSMSSAVDELLNAINMPDPPLRDYGLIVTEDGTYDDLGVVQGATWVNDPNMASAPDVRPSIGRLRMASLRKWWSGLMINQSRSIQEKIVLFWHHHFSVQYEEVTNPQMMYRHHQLLRTHSLGNVRTLTREVAIDPAMLYHLNGYLNSRLAADENFARELQELFTIGVGGSTRFTETDVIAAARVLTGWRVRTQPQLESYSDTSDHDTGSKQFSSFYNNTVIAGGDAAAELDALINMIFARREAAEFICRKLYRFFVYYDIDAATETDVITPLATLLMSSNYEIKPVLETLFKSEHFYDIQCRACFIKTPLDFLLGTLREYNVSYPPYTDYTNGYPLFDVLYHQAATMQMDLFQPPDVNGYPAFVQGPMHYELWVNSNSLPRRADYTDALVADNIIDVRAFVNQCSNPANPDVLISEMCSLLLGYPLSDASKNYTKSRFLLANGTDNNVWTNAWNSNSPTVDASLKSLLAFLMNLPEFHLC